MNIVLTGGGTAGHVIPNLALVKELEKHFDNIYYIGSDKENEKTLVEKYNIPYYSIDAPKFIRQMTLKNLSIPYKMVKSIQESKKLLKSLNADVVFSKGGYIALPVVIASHKLGLKTIIHESDTSMGLANKISARYCDKICTSFDFQNSSDKYVYTGSPIREEFLSPQKRNYFKNNNPTILVIGGSQGSKYINDFIYENINIITQKYNVIHICGAKKSQTINNPNYMQIEFSNDIATLISSSDIVLTRGGSNALFEILTVGKPMIIVPLANKASRGEQIDNAKYFMQHNLGCYMPTLEISCFMDTVKSELENKDKISSLQNSFIKQNGNKNIVDVILKIV